MNFIAKYVYEKDGKIYKSEKMIEADTEDDVKLLLYEKAVEEGIQKLDIIEIIPIAILYTAVVSEYEFEVEKLPLGYRLSWNGIAFKCTNIKVKSDECTMHLEITTSMPVSSEIVYQGKFNLYSERATTELIKKCEKIIPQKDYGLNWEAIIQQWKKRLYLLIREGNPVEEIDTSQIQSTYSYLINPFIIKDTINLIYGEGGTGKSTIALCFAMLPHSEKLQQDMHVSVKPFNTLYLDYENNKIVLQNVLKLLYNSYGISTKIKYRTCHVPLQIEFENIANIISEHDIDLIIIDSLAPAAGATFETEEIISFYQALQKLEKTILLIGHTPKDTTNDTVYGSVFFHNLARNVWQLKKKIVSMDSFNIFFIHKKCNVSKLHSIPYAYELSYQDKGVLIHNISVEEVENASTNMQIIISCLKKYGALTPKEIAEKTSLNHGSVKTLLRRLVDKGICITFNSGNSTLYALKENEPF